MLWVGVKAYEIFHFKSCLLTFTNSISQVYKGHEFIQHSGGMEAFGTNVIIFPALKYGLVAFGNTAVTANVVEEIIMWHLIDDKLKIPQAERFDWAEQ
jgi:hypothetical protein